MPTFARRIDALGGTESDQSEDWNDGYSAALREATDIAEEADDVISELVGSIEDFLSGNFSHLPRFAEEAETLCRRINERTAR
jgi:hypothetical protein